MSNRLPERPPAKAGGSALWDVRHCTDTLSDAESESEFWESTGRGSPPGAPGTTTGAGQGVWAKPPPASPDQQGNGITCHLRSTCRHCAVARHVRAVSGTRTEGCCSSSYVGRRKHSVVVTGAWLYKVATFFYGGFHTQQR